MGKRLIGWLAIFIVALQTSGCGVSPLQITPYNPPLSTALAAYTQTARSSITPAPTSTPWPTFTPVHSPTETLSPTPTLTATPRPVVKLKVIIATCDTGIDILRDLGEVTNAYVVVQNVGTAGATNVEAILSASDEDKAHPDKSFLVQSLLPGNEIPLKLTVDTKEGVDTSIRVEVTSQEGVGAKASKASCKARVPEEDIINQLGKLFVVRKIPTP